MPHRVRGLGLLVLSLAVGSCGGAEPTVVEVSPVLSLAVVSGADQRWIAGQELPGVLEVVVTLDDKGKSKPVKGALVNFRVVSGGGSVFAGAALTNDDGIAREYWTLGGTPGLNTLQVRAVDPVTGEKQIFGEFRAQGVDPPEELAMAGGVVDDAWAREVVERLDAPLSADLTTAMEGISASLGERLDTDGVETSLAATESLVATIGSPFAVEGAFLKLFVARARSLYETALEKILGTP